MAPVSTVQREELMRRWLDLPSDMPLEMRGRHRSLRRHGKERRDTSPGGVVATDSGSDDDNDGIADVDDSDDDNDGIADIFDSDDDNNGIADIDSDDGNDSISVVGSTDDIDSDDDDDSNNTNGAQQLPPKPNASTDTTPGTTIPATTAIPAPGTTATIPATTVLPTVASVTAPTTTSLPAPDTTVAAATALSAMNLATTSSSSTITSLVPLTTSVSLKMSPFAINGGKTSEPFPANTPPVDITSTIMPAKPSETGSPALYPGSNATDKTGVAATGPPPQSRDPTVERVLISVGSVGALMAICFVWFAWRAWRRRKQERGGYLSSGGSNKDEGLTGGGLLFRLRQRMVASVPFVHRRRDEAWEDLWGSKGTRSSISPSTYSGGRATGNWYGGNEKKAADGVMREVVLGDSSYVYPLTVPPKVHDSQPHTTTIQGATALSSTAGSGTSGTTMQWFLSDPFADGPSQQRANRTTGLSSLSSGFGDGVQQQQQQQQQQQPVAVGLLSPSPPPPPLPPLPPSSGRFSWIRSNGYNRRASGQTAYTEASEDRPARFRSITSWVHSQAGRVQRVAQ